MEMPAWLRKLLITCPFCERQARDTGIPYRAVYRRYHPAKVKPAADRVGSVTERNDDGRSEDPQR